MIIAMFNNVLFFEPLIKTSKADPGDINTSWDNSTTLNVTVLQVHPRVNWYDFQYNQSGTWVSKLNQQIDVNNSAEYRFIVNISSDQGWSDIEFINITGWHDAGSEATTYNQTAGGNINLFLRYENTSATGNSAVWTLQWPDDEISLNSADCTETEETDPNGEAGVTECYNITFAFTPGYQFRYANGGGSWNTNSGYNDTWSWNFNISAEDQSGYMSYNNPLYGESIDEFGVYSYTEIVSAGWPEITGTPGDNPAYNDSYISIVTRSNNNYSLRVNASDLVHKISPSYTIGNDSIWTAGGELGPLTKFDGLTYEWYYGGIGSYTSAKNDDTSLITNDIEWAVTIDIGQYPGDYEATIYYRLLTEI